MSESQWKVKARDLTAEIDRATDPGLNQRPDQMAEDGVFDDANSQGQSEILDSERMRGLGRQAMANGGVDAEVVAAVELSDDLNRIENPEEYVGEATEVQRREYQAEDERALQNEAGIGNPLEVGVVKKTVSGVTRAVEGEIGKLMRKPSFDLRTLEDLYAQGSDVMLVDVFNRHKEDRN